MIPGVNIIGEKASIAGVNGAGESGAVLAPLLPPPARVLEGGALKKCLGSKEHPDWLKIDLIAAEIITDQKYKRTKN